VLKNSSTDTVRLRRFSGASGKMTRRARPSRTRRECGALTAGKPRGHRWRDKEGNPPHPEEPPAATGEAAGVHDTQAQGVLNRPAGGGRGLGPSVFSRVNATEAIPSTWEERARKAWEYYVEEPLVKNCVNSWCTRGRQDRDHQRRRGREVGGDRACRPTRSAFFVKNMILRLRVKSDAVCFKRYAKDSKNI